MKAKLEQLAREVIPPHSIDTFLAMEPADQILGLKVLSALGGDQSMIDTLALMEDEV